ncbi:ankyrin repeat domain-containing protein [Aspergillus alliaceus]|uniref:ankyrin repeat domain-containing protein n=1 Tax=Petromyces alliaceus TaxID=209559 RepID=UPI0012A72C4F|nr:uncharacterized protein BDW43DRAFT_306729 [Aspergillus alliaceus]KAB8238029.1 hypothetical protein BDW43DRAFT_306729 [Aspergillus alliaceus]
MAPDYDSFVGAYTLRAKPDLDEGLALATEDAHSDLVAALFDADAHVSDWTVAALPGRLGVQQHESVVRQYLDHGFDANGSYRNGIPILVQMSNPACARELISRGPDPNHTSLIELLLAHGAKLEPDLLFKAVAPRVPQGEFMTRYILARGLDPNTTSVKWRDPLHRAIHSARPNIVKLLLDAGADPTGQSAHPQYRGGSPLQIAKDIQLSELQQAILTLLQCRGVDVGGGGGIEGAG